MTSANKLHIFVGTFDSLGHACKYTLEQWSGEPEPAADVSDEEYYAWEARNPSWALRADLGVYLDPDFMETIDVSEGYDYLNMYQVNPNVIGALSRDYPDANSMLLIFPDALGGFDSTLSSTPKLTYCGAYAFGRPGR